jgi:hypothetical protein
MAEEAATRQPLRWESTERTRSLTKASTRRSGRSRSVRKEHSPRPSVPRVTQIVRRREDLMRRGITVALFVAALAVIGACNGDTVSPPPEKKPTWWVEPDSMNLGILVLDYISYELKGGRVDHFALCDTCDRNSLPFEVTYRPPMDFGSITFTYTETGDTILYATTIWNGVGAIEVPEDMLPPGDFKQTSWRFAPPTTFEYYSNEGKTSPSAAADTAWSHVASLDVVGTFAKSDFRVGIYHHGASHASWLPEYDSWVIFLYRGRLTNEQVCN